MPSKRVYMGRFFGRAWYQWVWVAPKKKKRKTKRKARK